MFLLSGRHHQYFPPTIRAGAILNEFWNKSMYNPKFLACLGYWQRKTFRQTQFKIFPKIILLLWRKGPDLWIFHFLKRFSFVKDFSIWLRIRSRFSSLSKSSLDVAVIRLHFRFNLSSWLVTFSEKENMFDWRLPSSCLAPPFSPSRKLSSESCCRGELWKEFCWKFEKKPSGEIMKEVLFELY